MKTPKEKTSVDPVGKKIYDNLEREIKLLELLGYIKPINPKRIAPKLNYVAQAFEKK